MADQEQLEHLSQGIDHWNQWRQQHPDIQIDLSKIDFAEYDMRHSVGLELTGVDFSEANLSESKFTAVVLESADLSGANLRKAEFTAIRLSGANLTGSNVDEAIFFSSDLSKVNLSGVNLVRAEFSIVEFNEAILRDADLSGVSFGDVGFVGADLRRANLSKAELKGVDLSDADLRWVNFKEADLSFANLSKADLSNADLRSSNLEGARLLRTKLSQAVLTGACIKDWSLNRATTLKGIEVDYVYRDCLSKIEGEEVRFLDRRPHSGKFKPDEFISLYQKVLDTIEIVLMDGINWEAFSQSLSDLRSRYVDQTLSIQSMEWKGKAFAVYLEVLPGSDKAAIHYSAIEFYETRLELVENRYREVLNAKEREISVYRQQCVDKQETIRLLASRNISVEVNAVSDSSTGKNDLRSAQFGGGYAEKVEGDQRGGTINNYGSAQMNDIMRLITTLRHQVEALSDEHKSQVLHSLQALELEVKEDKPIQDRIKKRLKQLTTIAVTLPVIAGGAAAFSGNLKDFASNVDALAEIIGIPLEQIQASETPEP